MSAEANKALARRYFEDLFNAATLDSADEILAADFCVHALHRATLSPVPERGPAAFKQGTAAFRDAFPDTQASIDAMLAEGDRVMVLWTFSGTHRGPYAGLAATGKHITYRGINIFRIADGKLAEGWDLIDRLAMWQLLGVLPETAVFLAQARGD